MEKGFRIAALLFCVVALSASGAEEASYARLRETVDRIGRKVHSIDLKLTETRREVISGLMANVVERATRDCATDHERAIALALWIGRNYHNTSDIWVSPYGGGGPYASFAFRIGPCGSRSLTHLYLADYVGIPGKLFNMYHEGHTTSHLFYDGGMHLFDTQRGIYFQKDGRVLNFFEMMTDPSLAGPENRVIIPLTNATWNRREERVRKIPEEHTKEQFLAATFTEAPGQIKYYFEPGSRCEIKAVIDVERFRQGDIVYGTSGKDMFDIRGKMKADGLGFYLGRFGSLTEFADHRLVFQGARPGDRFQLRIEPYRFRNMAGGSFFARGRGFRIDAGEKYAGKGDWTVEFTAEREEPELLLCNDFERPGRGFDVSVLEIRKLERESGK